VCRFEKGMWRVWSVPVISVSPRLTPPRFVSCIIHVVRFVLKLRVKNYVRTMNNFSVFLRKSLFYKKKCFNTCLENDYIKHKIVLETTWSVKIYRTIFTDQSLYYNNYMKPKTYDLSPRQVKKLVSPELFLKYDQLLLQTSLDTMSDVTFCPRPTCQAPVLMERETTMALCSHCSFVFCTLCRLGYHGLSPCRLKAGWLMICCF